MDLHRRLAEITGSTQCLEYDACPHNGIIANIDGYPASESKLPWMTWRDWGWKAVIAAASDIAASGGVPRLILYSIGVPGAGEAVEVAMGVAEAARWLQASVGKSDTNRADSDAWIDVAVIGVGGVISRSEARPGEAVVQIGYAGYGLASRMVLEGYIGVDRLPGRVLEYTRRPTPPIKIGPRLVQCGATAAADNSDGLAYTAWLIAHYSGVKIELDTPLIDPGVVGALGSPDPRRLYESWEDYNIVATIPYNRLDCLMEACRAGEVPCKVIGETRSGRGISVMGEDLEPQGWRWV
ncbi:MAG: AIR synthase related protein [Desulfurococcales archaeon]|nr:AIR synthase related protein [Desulfurococcales archaeon]